MKFVKHPLVIFLGGALTLYVISGLISGNWNPFMAHTSTPNKGGTGKVPILDANGNATGGYATAPSTNASSRNRIPCQKVTVGAYTGYIGDCKYPITTGV